MRLIAACTLLFLSLGAYAQGYPNRPVKLVVADAAGGAPDQLGRMRTSRGRC